MTEQEKAKLEAELDLELEKPEAEIDTEKIDRIVAALSEDIEVPADAGKRAYQTIIKKNHIEPSKISKKKTKHHILLVAAILLLISTCIFTVSANPDFFIKGLRQIGNKLKLYTVVSNAESTSNEFTQQFTELLASKDYALPKAISNMQITRFEKNNRAEECTDICLELIDETNYLNIIISTYENSKTGNFEAPANNIEPYDQFAVGKITVTVFQVDDVFTAYYAHRNHTYQITSDMEKQDFYDILQQIEIQE